MSDFRTRLRQRERLLGTVLALGSGQTAECLALSGFDWLWIDMEHGPIDLATAQAMLQAIGSRCPAVVRVPSNDPVWLKRVLDLGAAGVIIPHVSSGEAARKAVDACRYPPRGTRSAGVARAQGYGLGLGDYLQTAHETVAIIVQIEHIDAVKNIDEIAAVEGVDCALVGPFDLSGSLGRPGELEHPSVVDAIAQVKSRCDAQRVPLGIFAPNPKMARAYVDAGFTLVAVGVDSLLLTTAATALLAELGRT